MSTADAQDYAESASAAREGQEMALRMIRRDVRNYPSDDEKLIFWVEGYTFWKESEKRWIERLKALREEQA